LCCGLTAAAPKFEHDAFGSHRISQFYQDMDLDRVRTWMADTFEQLFNG
jgi:hypothetical protein